MAFLSLLGPAGSPRRNRSKLNLSLPKFFAFFFSPPPPRSFNYFFPSVFLAYQGNSFTLVLHLWDLGEKKKIKESPAINIENSDTLGR